MSKYRIISRCVIFEYGYDDDEKEYYYRVYDTTRKHINNGLIEFGGSRTTSLPPIVLAEKLKQINAPQEHIQKILWMRKI